MSNQEPDGWYAAFWKGTPQNGIVASGLDELELIVHERLEEDAAYDCMAMRDGWQIKPVMLIDPQELTRLRLIEEWARETDEVYQDHCSEVELANGMEAQHIKYQAITAPVEAK